jgi:hypothetical protein
MSFWFKKRIKLNSLSHWGESLWCRTTASGRDWQSWRRWLFSYVFPWLGGDFKIWLRSLSSQRIICWQGDGESRFKENLKILERQTGLPVRRG